MSFKHLKRLLQRNPTQVTFAGRCLDYLRMLVIHINDLEQAEWIPTDIFIPYNVGNP